MSNQREHANWFISVFRKLSEETCKQRQLISMIVFLPLTPPLSPSLHFGPLCPAADKYPIHLYVTAGPSKLWRVYLYCCWCWGIVGDDVAGRVDGRNTIIVKSNIRRAIGKNWQFYCPAVRFMQDNKSNINGLLNTTPTIITHPARRCMIVVSVEVANKSK